MTFSPITTNIAKKLKSLKIMNIRELHNYEVAKFMYKMYKEILSEVFSNYINPIQHTYITRHRLRSHYELSTPNSNIGKSSAKFSGVKVWGNLSEDLQTATSIERFKELYKQSLFKD